MEIYALKSFPKLWNKIDSKTKTIVTAKALGLISGWCIALTGVLIVAL